MKKQENLTIFHPIFPIFSKKKKVGKIGGLGTYEVDPILENDYRFLTTKNPSYKKNKQSWLNRNYQVL